jgi:hypothetical protein
MGAGVQLLFRLDAFDFTGRVLDVGDDFKPWVRAAGWLLPRVRSADS